MGEETTRYHDGANLLANVELSRATSAAPQDSANSRQQPAAVSGGADSSVEAGSTEGMERKVSTAETTVRHDSESTAGDSKFWAEINLQDER